MLGYMPPRGAVNHISHTHTADAIISGEGRYADSAFGKTLSRLDNLLFIKFCQRNSCSIWLSILGYLVRHIIVVCTQEQMFWIAARWVIAFMKNPKPVGNKVVCQYPCDTMGRDSLVNKPKLPISLTVPVSLPQPAIIGAKNIYLRPKVRCDLPRARAASVVRVNKSDRLPFGVSLRVLISFCNRRFLAASTLTKAVAIKQAMFSHPERVILKIGRKVCSWLNGKLELCEARGIITHVVSSLLAIGHIQGRVASTPPGVFYWFNHSILAQVSAFCNHSTHVRDTCGL